MSDEQLSSIRKRSNRTSGNWLADYLKLKDAQIVLTDDVPELIEEVERLQKELTYEKQRNETLENSLFLSSEVILVIDNVEEIEDAILGKTAEIWNMFIALEQTHPSDINDLADAIHDIQKILSVRIARRVKPNQFVTIKN
jgi:hypothetical protein